MTVGYNIKTAIWPQFSVAGSVLTNTYLVDGTINGEILKIQIKNAASPGSIWFGESGGAVLITKNNITSGTSAFDIYPRQYLTEPTGNGAIVIGSLTDRTVVNAPLYMALSGMTSGTSNVFGPVTIYYR